MLQHQHNSSDASVTKQAADTLVFQPDTNHADTIHANAEGAETNADTQEAQWRLIETAALDDAERTAINVPRLRRKLSKRSLLRRAGIDWDKPAPLTTEKFAVLLSRLRSPAPAAWRERVLCAWLLGHAPLTADQKREAALELGNVLQNRHAKRRERYNANLRDVARYTIPFAALFTLFVDFQLMHSPSLDHYGVYPLVNSLLFQLAGVLVSFCSIGVFWYFLLYPLLFPFITARNIARNSRVRGAAALALGRLRAPEGVEALSRAVLDHSPHVRALAEPALHLCLPALTNQYYGHLGPSVVPALCQLLDHKKERLFAYHVRTERLVLHTLTALEKIGTGEAAPSVAKVARDGWTAGVREAAQQILPILEERQRQENDPRILLRASTLPQSGETLLRAVPSALYDHIPEQLLRPQVSE